MTTYGVSINEDFADLVNSFKAREITGSQGRQLGKLRPVEGGHRQTIRCLEKR